MVDSVVAFYVKEEAAPGEVSEVYIPDMRVIQGTAELPVLGLLGIDLERVKVIQWMDAVLGPYTLLVDLTSANDVKGHVKLCRLEELNDLEMGILYEAYLAERLCPYFREAVSDKACQWAGKNRIVDAICCDSMMDVFFPDGKTCCFSPDSDAVFDEWLSFCEANQIDRVSRERLEEMVDDYFVHYLDADFPEENAPSFCWTSEEIRRMLSFAEMRQVDGNLSMRVEYKNGYADFDQRPGSPCLKPLGNLTKELKRIHDEYHTDVVLDFRPSR